MTAAPSGTRDDRAEEREELADAIARTVTDTGQWNIWVVADALLPVVDRIAEARAVARAQQELWEAAGMEVEQRGRTRDAWEYDHGIADYRRALRDRADALAPDGAVTELIAEAVAAARQPFLALAEELDADAAVVSFSIGEWDTGRSAGLETAADRIRAAAAPEEGR